MKIDRIENRDLLQRFLLVQKRELVRLESRAPRTVQDLKEISGMKDGIVNTEQRISDFGA
jgi:hypothetical protein